MKIPLSIEKCTTYDREPVLAAMRVCLDRLGGMKAFVAPGQRVLLKPNLLAPKPYTTTDASIVEAVARLVLEVGATPVVGDSCAIGSAAGVAKKAGMTPGLESLGLEPVLDLGKSRPGGTLNGEVAHPQVSSGLDGFDAVINLPKIKVHQQCYLTLGVKNLYGCVPGRRKALWHFKVGADALCFAKMLVVNCHAIAPVLTIADGIMAMERLGPMNGDPNMVGLITACGDTLALDRVWVEILGADPEKHLVLEAAHQLGMSASLDMENIEILGPPLEDCLARNFKLCADEDMMPVKFSLPHILRGLWRQFRARRTKPVSVPVS